MTDTSTPKGEIVVRTMAMPADTNANGDIFGGWLLSQMDIGAGIAAKHRCRGRTVTVAIDAMAFLSPVRVGDIVTCFASVTHVGRTSMQIKIEAWTATAENTEVQEKVTEGSFTFVAIDDDGRPRPIPNE